MIFVHPVTRAAAFASMRFSRRVPFLVSIDAVREPSSRSSVIFFTVLARLCMGLPGGGAIRPRARRPKLYLEVSSSSRLAVTVGELNLQHWQRNSKAGGLGSGV